VGRRRFGVALMVPPPMAAEVDVLRRACGSADIDAIAPHVTLVPPVNVRDDAVECAEDLLAAAAAGHDPIVARLGPVGTFLPVNPVVFLAVDAVLHPLKTAVFREPLSRRVDHQFVPHVTLVIGATPARIDALVAGLSDWSAEVTFDALTLLEEVRDDAGVRRWEPIADWPLGGLPVVRGRGSLDVTVTAADRGALPPSTTPFTVTATIGGRPAGWAHGWVAGEVAWLDALIVEPGWRRMGVGRHLLGEVELAAARRGATRIEARGHAFLAERGWGPPGFAPVMARALPSREGNR
jgi:2'-5' RNA ligase